jgi:hypothetical protein
MPPKHDDPMGQMVQSVTAFEPLTDVLPSAQATGAVDAAGQYVPIGHDVQEEAPALEKLPAAH